MSVSDSKHTINRLTSASLDLEGCVRFLDALEEQKYGTTAYEALLISAVVFYVRPFSENEKKSSTSPSDPRVPDAVLTGLSESERKLHEELRILRNKAIAHAEWILHPTGVSSSKVIKALPFSIWKWFPSSSEISAFRDVALKVRHAVQNAQANALHNLPQHLVPGAS